MYLLDTNVLSELRKRSGSQRVKQWVASQNAADMHLSVVTIIELETGIMLRERHDPNQAAQLRQWLDRNVLRGFGGRILPLDLPAARRVPPLHVPDKTPQHDALIAGTALARGFTVVTRNVNDFTDKSVPCINPWQ